MGGLPDYQGIAWINVNTGEVIVADRGTQSATDILKSDSHIALNQPFDAQTLASKFAEDVIKSLDRDYPGIKITQVYDTGHSLGGTEGQSQMITLSQLTPGVPPIFVGVNSPRASLGGALPTGIFQVTCSPI